MGVQIKNKKARHEYELIDEYEAGIQLTGTEIKSIRAGKASIVEAFCAFIKDELYIRNMYIKEYEQGTYNNHLPKRDRKLLLHRDELRKIKKAVSIKGYTIVPILLFINSRGWAKVKISTAKGKKLYDKRHDLKTKDTKRELDRQLKQFR